MDSGSEGGSVRATGENRISKIWGGGGFLRQANKSRNHEEKTGSKQYEKTKGKLGKTVTT